MVPCRQHLLVQIKDKRLIVAQAVLDILYECLLDLQDLEAGFADLLLDAGYIALDRAEFGVELGDLALKRQDFIG